METIVGRFGRVDSSKSPSGKAENQSSNNDGCLKADRIASLDDLADEDFSNSSRSVQLPRIPQILNAVIGAKGKPVLIKKNIFEKNRNSHQFTPEQNRDILEKALYDTDLVGRTNPDDKPNYWVAVNIGNNSPIVVLDVTESKDNIEIVSWYTLDKRNLERIERQAKRNGGELIMLSTDKVESLSTPAQDLPSGRKSTQSPDTKQERVNKI